MNFVRVTKKWGKKFKYEDSFDGFLVLQNKDVIEIVGVGPEKKDEIKRFYFYKDDPETKYEVKPSDKASVEHYFKLSLLSSSNDLNDSYFNLLDQKRRHILAKEHYKNVFKKELIFEQIELDGV